MSLPNGIVYLVGAGPGDPGLLTRRGAEVLSKADVVVYDHLATARLLELAPASAERVCAGKSIGHCTLPQEAINRLIAERAREGKVVVRLKGGDPFVFGRGAEEAEHLHAQGIPFQVVPGVTAAVGVTAYAGVPVTHRDVSSAVALVTGHHDPDASDGQGRLDWAALARFPGTLVVYMGVTRLERLCRALIRNGRPAATPAALIEAGTTARQRTVAGTLEDLHDRVVAAGLGPPALLVVGEVVARRPVLAWFETLPLFGQRIVVTRPVEEAERSAASLEAMGAEVLVAPTVEIRPLDNYRQLDQTIGRLGEFEWLVFTSSNGVRHFLDRLETLRLDLRVLGHLKLAAIGPATAEALGRYRLRPDLLPESYRSEGLVLALADQVRGRRVLLARADRGRTLLRDELETIAEVTQVAVYRNADAETLPPEVLTRIEDASVDWITLTSSAITERLYALLPQRARGRIGAEIRLASLSPVTTATAAALGWPVAAEATVHTWDGLVDAIAEAVARSPRAPQAAPVP